jgi:hypothetical protein
MDGQFLNNSEVKYTQYLKKWLTESIESKSWERFDNLHIDEVDILFSKRELWLDGSLYLYSIVCKIIDKSMYDCLLSIPLIDGKTETVFNSANIMTMYIKEHINEISPPSMYIFKKDDVNYNSTLSQSHYLEKLSKELNVDVYFSEKENESNEFDRTIFVTGGVMNEVVSQAYRLEVLNKEQS